jgi:hypothetical protein
LADDPTDLSFASIADLAQAIAAQRSSSTELAGAILSGSAPRPALGAFLA